MFGLRKYLISKVRERDSILLGKNEGYARGKVFFWGIWRNHFAGNYDTYLYTPPSSATHAQGQTHVPLNRRKIRGDEGGVSPIHLSGVQSWSSPIWYLVHPCFSVLDFWPEVCGWAYLLMIELNLTFFGLAGP